MENDYRKILLNQEKLNIEKKYLLQSLRSKGNFEEKVLKAMAYVPRELFVLEEYIDKTYEDNALPLICGQSISQPYTVAYMTNLLQTEPGQKVLEIGTGSGYQSCILAELGTEVYTIERIPELYEYARKRIEKLGYKIHQKLDDGTIGWKEHAPYDRIIVTAAAPQTPLALLSQLKIGGKMVIPVGDRSSQTMKRITRISETNFETEDFSTFRFVPLIGKQGWEN